MDKGYTVVKKGKTKIILPHNILKEANSMNKISIGKVSGKYVATVERSVEIGTKPL